MQADLDTLADNLLQFPNVIGEGLDLDPFMDEEIIHRVKPAGAYKDAMLRLILREDESQRSEPLPFNVLKEKFELRKHELTVWSGYKRHGKSALISQVLVAQMKRQQRMFIISPEFRPEAVLERMLYQFTGTQAVDAEDIKTFLAWADRFVWLYDNQASLKPRVVIALCRYGAKELKADHILIDSLMKCGIDFDDYSGQKRFVDKVQSIAHAYPLHIHLVAHARKGKGRGDEGAPSLHDVKGGSEIADLAENVLMVWRNTRKEKEKGKHDSEPDAQLIVEAQRNARGWIGVVSLFYDPDCMLFYEPGYAPERADRVRF
ncbi:MAG: AAA family ATPase [Methylobacillus sp.]|jgi:twinkle protein|nr:AAA family ATPase [Methylobacillus sp.]